MQVRVVEGVLGGETELGVALIEVEWLRAGGAPEGWGVQSGSSCVRVVVRAPYGEKKKKDLGGGIEQTAHLRSGTWNHYTIWYVFPTNIDIYSTIKPVGRIDVKTSNPQRSALIPQRRWKRKGSFTQVDSSNWCLQISGSTYVVVR